jgi:hypothetical protein
LERRICALALAVPDEVHLLGTFGDWSIMRHAYSEDSAAHGGLHAGGDRAEGCHVLFHLGNLMSFHRRQHRLSVSFLYSGRRRFVQKLEIRARPCEKTRTLLQAFPTLSSSDSKI